jgi:short-subunit dehydrogenase
LSFALPGGAIDLLVCNAGISMGALFEDLPDASVATKVMQVNFFGTYYCIEHALPFLIKSYTPRIAVVGSNAGMFGIPTRTGYSASKFALQGLCESLRLEVETKYGIAITMLCPGPVATNINDHRITKGTVGNFDKDSAMPINVCCDIIRNAIATAKQQELFLLKSRLATGLLKTFFPNLLNSILLREVRKAGVGV